MGSSLPTETPPHAKDLDQKAGCRRQRQQNVDANANAAFKVFFVR
jgi:hypothetical protein